MARMEFLKDNPVNTTTMVVASTGTGTFSFLYNRNDSLAYATVGYTTDTSTLLSIEFLGPTVISNILLKNHNLRGYRLFYNSLTANSLAVVSQNSQTSTYFNFASITVNSVQIQMDSAMTTDTERRVGEFVPTERRLQFSENPSSGDYDPSVNLTKIIHSMPDGGKAVFNIRHKFKAKISLDFISSTFRDSLLNIYEEAEPFYFLPFPTTGSDWDRRAHEVIWTNDFNFKHDDNSKTQGYSGEIVIEETPGA